MIYRIIHKTVYAYAEPALTCHNQLHLTPRELDHQRCLRSRVNIDPAPRAMAEHKDYFGNIVVDFEIDEPHACLSITATSRVEVKPGPQFDPSATPAWDQVRRQVAADRDALTLSAYQFVFASRHTRRGGDFAEYAQPSFAPQRPLLEAVMDLTGRIHAQFKYDPAATTIATSLEEVLAERHGVCQDFAHIQLACLRSMGLPARYVSGYLRTDPPEGQQRLIGADASHAWIDVYCPSLGWVGFDPTNNCIVGDRHIIVAVGRDFADVSPIKGVVLGGGAHELTVSVDVAPMA